MASPLLHLFTGTGACCCCETCLQGPHWMLCLALWDRECHSTSPSMGQELLLLSVPLLWDSKFRLWPTVTGCATKAAALWPTSWVLSHGTALPSLGSTVAALSPIPYVLSHSVDLASIRLSSCCSILCLLGPEWGFWPPASGHAATVP